MNLKRYVTSFIVFTIILALVLSIFSFNENIMDHMDIVIYGYIGLSLLSLLTYVTSSYLEQSKNKSSLLSLTFSNMLLKLLFTVVVILVYYKFGRPASGLFVIPYIILYIGFTVFEIYLFNSQVKR